MTNIRVSPGGIGYVRPTATKAIPGQPEVAKAARRRLWLRRESNTGRPVPLSSSEKQTK